MIDPAPNEPSPPAPPTASRARPKPQRKRRRGRTFLFAMIVLSVLGLLQEAAFRLLFPIPEVVGFNRVRYQMLAEQDPRFRSILKRGLAYDRLLIESVPDGFSDLHRLNLYGFRSPDFAIDPPRGRRRVLVIGDSVTEGQGADDTGTIPAALGGEFAGAGEPAEVINLGVIAATLHHVNALARDAIYLLKPTDVVLVLYANDLPAPFLQLHFDSGPPVFPRWHAPWWLPRAFVLGIRTLRDEPIYSRWPKPAVRFFAPVPDSTNPWSKKPVPPENLDPALYEAMKTGRLNPWLVQQAEGMPGMLSHDFAIGGSALPLLKRVAEDCAAVNARLLVAYVPFCGITHPRYADAQVKLTMPKETAEALATDPKYRRQPEHLAAVTETLGLPFADATPALREAEAAGKPQFWEYDTHPRPEGYATIARRIFEVWRRAANAGPGRPGG